MAGGVGIRACVPGGFGVVGGTIGLMGEPLYPGATGWLVGELGFGGLAGLPVGLFGLFNSCARLKEGCVPGLLFRPLGVFGLIFPALGGLLGWGEVGLIGCGFAGLPGGG